MQGLILAFVAGMPMAAVFLLPKGLTADIADYDALIRGERREAMFYSTQNFFEKLTYALPPLLLSLCAAIGRFARRTRWAFAWPHCWPAHWCCWAWASGPATACPTP